MWIYSQSTGELNYFGSSTEINTIVLPYTGYSGKGDGKNNPDLENVEGVGPIPRGVYDIQAPVDTVTHGPYVLPLTPEENNDMYGRSGFLIHGDSIVDPGNASEGCIILPRVARNAVWDSGDHKLNVIA